MNKIYFYVPNLIGYVRLVLMIYSFFIYRKNFTKFFIVYFLGFALDDLDGRLARLFN